MPPLPCIFWRPSREALPACWPPRCASADIIASAMFGQADALLLILWVSCTQKQPLVCPFLLLKPVIWKWSRSMPKVSCYLQAYKVGAALYLAIPVSQVMTSVITLEMQADSLRYVVNTSPALILSAKASSVPCMHPLHTWRALHAAPCIRVRVCKASECEETGSFVLSSLAPFCHLSRLVVHQMHGPQTCQLACADLPCVR